MAIRKLFNFWTILLLLVVLSCVTIVLNRIAEAAPLPPYETGYFRGQVDGGGAVNNGFVLVPGVDASVVPLQADSPTQRQRFVNHVINCLNGGAGCSGEQNRVGAQFIIQTIRGNNGDFDRGYPDGADVADFTNRVLNFPGTIDFARASYSYSVNSRYQNQSDVSGPDDTFYVGSGSPSLEGFIVFTYAGQVRYVLKRNCANPIGTILGLPIPDRPVVGTFTSATCTALRGNARDPDIATNAVRLRVTATNLSTGAVTTRVFDSATGGGRTSFDSGDFAGVDNNGWNIETSVFGLDPTRVYRFRVYAEQYFNGWTNSYVELSGSPRDVGPCYNYSLRPLTNVSTTLNPNLSGSSVDAGETSIVFSNSVQNTGTTLSRPSLLVSKNFYVLPNETLAVPSGIVDNVTNNCDARYVPAGSGGRCVQDGPTNGGAVTVFPANATTAAPAPVGTVTVDVSTFPIGTRVCHLLALAPPEDDSPAGVGRWGAPICIRIVAKPFLSVRGGDVSAGGGICNVTSANTNAGVFAWNANSGTFSGAGTQYGAFALGRVVGFASAQLTAERPRGLAFANTPATGGENYGGSFGEVPCIDDHYGSLPTTVSSLGSVDGINSSNSGVFQTPGGSFNGMTLLSNPGLGGVKKIAYVDGDVYITGNIVYQNRGGWATVDQIPAFKMVVRGNIYLAPTVTQLDGVYVAQPNGTDPNSGRIVTCVSGSTGALFADTVAYTSCNPQLVVNGSLIARKLELRRTNGTVSNSQPAEQVNFLPEVWLARWPDDGTANSSGYDAITGLPPVL